MSRPPAKTPEKSGERGDWKKPAAKGNKYPSSGSVLRSACLFFKLPLEIRFMIYSELIKCGDMELLRLCQKIHGEAIRTIYRDVRTEAALCFRYCAQLALNYAIMAIAQEIAYKMDKVSFLAGQSPLSITAAYIYMASHLMGRPKTLKDISAVVGVSDGTIHNAYKLIYSKREKLIDPSWLGEGKGDVALLPTV